MTPEQFKALDLKEGDIVRVTLDLRVTDIQDPATDAGRPLRGVTKNGVIFWPNIGDIRALEVIETTEAPLAVGDRVVHREFTSGESQAILEIRDYDGVPHLLTRSFNNAEAADGVLLFAPVANYVRAKA